MPWGSKLQLELHLSGSTLHARLRCCQTLLCFGDSSYWRDRTSTTEQLVSGLYSIFTNHPHLLLQRNSVRETYLKDRVPAKFGCRAQLDSHLIISDISVKLETDLLHFEWRWGEVSLDGLDSDTILPQLALLEESGLFRSTLSGLQELKLHQQQSSSWWTALVNFVGNLVMLVLFLGLVAFLSV
jgi:hypothetical protein